MNKKILLILAHPSNESLCSSIADSYEIGAKSGKHKLKRINLSGLSFDPILKNRYESAEPSDEIIIPKDLENARRNIKWADHIVYVFPTWWASMPALLKGFVDRVFVPGFGYEFDDEKKLLPNKLFIGKTSTLLITMDSPPLYYRFIVGEPGFKMMKDINKFVGIKSKRLYFGSVKLANDNKKAKWIKKAHKLGENAK